MNWARELSKGLIDPSQLKKSGLLPDLSVQQCQALKDNFDIRVPVAFLENATEAIKKQVIPDIRELNFMNQELVDPVGDEKHSPLKGITHRYIDRALLKVTHQCAVYCRFCFRRYKVSDASANLNALELKSALAYIQNHSEIWEVILTGGDPLVLTDATLLPILKQLDAIQHVKIIRIHTRIPSVLPSRITNELVDCISRLNTTVYIAAHINSPDELTPDTSQSLRKLAKAGVPLLSQTVLLKGVNDDLSVLQNLFKSLAALAVKPYYLHYPDLAQGTDHFRIPLEHAISLYQGLRGTIAGHCIPQFIVDIPDGFGKVTAESGAHLGHSEWAFKSPLDGEQHKVLYSRSE